MSKAYVSAAAIKPSQQSHSILDETRTIVAKMTQRERFEKAQRHLNDALNYEYPRNDLDSELPKAVRFSYIVQTSSWWAFFMSFVSLLYMYLVAMEPNNRLDLDVPLSIPTLVLSNVVLLLMLLDLAMEVVHKRRWLTKRTKKYNFRFWAKAIFLLLFLVDHAVFYSLYRSYPFRPFRILRACTAFTYTVMIYFYDPFSRKALNSLWGAAQDILAFVVFFMIIIAVFGIASAHIIVLPEGTVLDHFSQNFADMRTSVFLMYVLSTYDAWPDFQMPVLNASSWYYLFFVSFMFLNLLYFVTIPVTFIFASFKRTRSKIMLLDQVKQKNSLLLCFACLAEQRSSVDSSTFQSFMLFVYRDKLRYCQQIRDLTIKLDPFGTGDIFVTDFMKLGTYVEQNCQFKPPRFKDWQWFVSCRIRINSRLKLNMVVRSDWYEVVVATIVLTNLALVLVSLFQEFETYRALEIAFTAFYFFEFIVRLIGEGPERMFKESRSWVDLSTVITSVLLLLADTVVNMTLTKLTRMVSILRINRLIRILWRNTFFRRRIYLSPFYRKLRLLFNQLYICTIVGMRMFPLVLTCFYTISILGMERFDNRFAPVATSNYSTYDSYSSFRSLVQAHLLCVQFMIESSWSYITLDYAVRYGNFTEAVAFFSFVHFYMVLVMMSLMKGMAADFYEAINEKYDQVAEKQLSIIEKQELEANRKEQIEEITKIVLEGRPLPQDTIRKKEFVEHKINREMMVALIKLHKQRERMRERKSRTVLLLQHPQAEDITKSRKARSRKSSSCYEPSSGFISEHGRDVANHTQQQIIRRIDSHLQITEEVANVESQTDSMEGAFLDRIKLETDSTPVSLFPLYPTFLKKFLGRKIKIVGRTDHGEIRMDFDGHQHMTETVDYIGFSNKSTSFYVNGIAALLGVNNQEESRKKVILQEILKLKLSDPEKIQQYLRRTVEPRSQIEFDSVLRSVYLGGLNPTLVNKFEEEYFSDCYGNGFRNINKAIISPMLRQEALIISSFSKILRYPQIPVDDFFNLLAAIEHKISNESILRSGSIFKLVFQVEELGENWFAVELDKAKQLRLHFLKSSIWVYHHRMEANRIQYAHDIFSYEPSEYPGEEPTDCEKVIRLLYNSFESIGFSMLGEQDFFQTDPNNFVYDLYTLLLEIDQREEPQESPIPRIGFDFKISRVMVVMLVKENQRSQRLTYRLTSLESLLKERQEHLSKEDFKLEDDTHETLEKLQSMQADDERKISSAASLPHAYLVDTMISLQEIVESKKHNLARKAEQVLNREFNRLAEQQSSS